MSLTSAQQVLLAAADLHRDGRAEFSEWDLTVAVWKRDSNKFGCRGYEDLYPDHKRVMSEILGQSKRDNPVMRGFLVRSRPNYYHLTALGLAEADRLGRIDGADDVSGRSAELLYSAISPYVLHRVFLDHVRDQEEPKTWLAAATFLQLKSNSASELTRSLAAVRHAATAALSWMKDSQTESFRRGAKGGGETILKSHVEALVRFVDLLEQRFAVQMDAIRRKR